MSSNMSGPNPIPLAIVGIGCRFPGDATNPEKLWDLIANGKSAWSKIPADRWNADAFWHPDPDDTNGTHNAKGGHFLNQDLGRFDAGFFNISPQEAASMDPQQRFLLETTYEALESAGVKQEDIQKSNTAVYMAMFTRDYDRNVYKDMMSVPKYHVTGTGDAILANRISHLFDLSGPSVTMDTGCSGGMAAIAHACQALRSGQSDLALAGAVNLILTPDHMIGMANLHMLNVDGRSYSFDSRGAGYGRGEGVASLVIKRLDDAIRDNDPIRAILRDAACNQDGHTAGITLPSGPAQQALERQVWNALDLDPGAVGYVEAHGTGTLAGDGAELEGISKVFCQDRDAESPLFVGSIKSNIGHTECASGLAAVIKSVLILEKEAIPPNVNFEQPRESLKLSEKKIKVPEALVPWPQQKDVARISVNSFGYGGTNAHAVLERREQEPVAASEEGESSPRLFIMSAASQTSLLNMLGTNAEWISKYGNSDSALRDLSYTLSQRRSLLPWRFSAVASNQEELLNALAHGSKKADAITRISPGTKISFVFTGQGAQWPTMGRELLSESVFSKSFNRSNEILKELGCTWDLIEEIVKPKGESRLHEAELAQPATTAIQIALVELAKSWGVVPDSVIGHSSGEVGAAYAAGYLSQEQAIKVAFFRGFSSGMAKKNGCGKGSMIAVGVGEYDVEPYLDNLTQGIAVVACQNSPSSTTVSGDDAAITELSELLSQESIFNRKLAVETAYHSHHMQAAASEYKAALGDIVCNPSPDTGIEMFSTVEGALKTEGFDADYWVENLVSKVRFCDGLQALCEAKQAASTSRTQSQRIFIEMGPHAALAGPARQCMADLVVPMPYSYTSALVRGVGATQSALTMAGQVFNQGYPVNLAAVSASDKTSKQASVLTNLPNYSWDHTKRHWNESRLSKDYRFRKHPYHDLLGLRMTDNSPLRPSWRHMVGVEGLPWLRDHVVDGLMIFPGSGYLAMAVEAAAQLAGDRFPEKELKQFSLKDVYFLKGLVIPEGRARVEVQLSFNPIEVTDSETSKTTIQHGFSITAYAGDEKWSEHCRGVVVAEFKASKDDEALLAADITRGSLEAQIDSASGKVIQASELYQELERVGNAYGPTFAGVETMTISDDAAVSRILVPDVAAVMPSQYIRPHIVHPTTLDILLHTSLPLVHQKLGAGSVMPVHIESMNISANIQNTPGDLFLAVTALTSSSGRAADADLTVFSGAAGPDATPVISSTGMELRMLGAGDSDDAGQEGRRDICYDLKWVPDERFVSAEQLQKSQPASALGLLSQYAEHKAIKQSDLSIIELAGEGSTGTATRAFLKALESSNVSPAVYDFAAPEGQLDSIKEELKDQATSVNFRKLDIGSAELDSAFTKTQYDIVLASSSLHAASNVNSAVANVRKLLKPDGVLLLIEDSKDESEVSSLLSQASFKVQLTAQEDGSTFTVARAVTDAVATVSEIRLVSQESILPASLKGLVAELSSVLGSSGTQVTASAWSNLPEHDKDAVYVVIDDGSKPILAGVDQERFRLVVDLVQKDAKIVWVSVQDDEKYRYNSRKHLVTGLSRTGHAENEDLDLVTLDIQQTLNQTTQPAILELISEVVESFSNKDIPREREFVYNGTNVLVPRLVADATLNRQVSGKEETTIETTSFTGSKVSLKLGDGQKGFVFVENTANNEPLEDDHIEIEAKAFGIPSGFKAGQSGIVNEYAGIVTATGSKVSTLSVGDRVVAISADSFANHLRVPATQARVIPTKVSFKDAAALPRAFMAVSHALVDVADVQSGQVVLVDGATSEIGQAALIAAQHFGATVIAAVSRVDEAAFIRDTFNLPSSQIVPRDSHLGQRQIQKLASGGLDVILGCARSPVPAVTSQLLKPFGTLVHIRNGINDAKQYHGTAHPSNATVSAFDIDSLLQARPQKVPQLLQRATDLIEQGLSLTPQSVNVVALNDNLEEVIGLAQKRDSIIKHVLEVRDESTVKVEKPSYQIPKLEPDATYVVAGGLGDLGQRLLHLMARAGARYLVTLSRKGAGSADAIKLAEELKEYDANVSLLAINSDVSRVESIAEALAEIKSNGFPSVKGVIQSAVILRDSTLDTMTAELFNSVVTTKAEGTLNLHEVFVKEDLTFFISFSSVMSIIGGKAQANYNAGNALQDAFAQFERSTDCFYMSLNIGGIQDAGVNNEAIIQSIRRQGLTLISHEELAAYFEYALSAHPRETGCHQPVIGFTSESIVATTAINGSAHSSMFTHVRQKAAADADDDKVKQKKTFKDIVKEGANKEEIAAFVARSIGDKLADLMALDPEEVNLGSSISDYGLDSLVAIELRNWLMREFDSPLQSSEVLDSPDIWTLAQKVTGRSKLVNTEPEPSSSTEASGSEKGAPSTLPTTRSTTPEVKA
ncbi:Highly reducing polyketide synthase SAT13 [Paramyrothecium foliicola]|nr:Highly reducing polyketide synthase SAT13 [Paramyrothecium foliicola]